MQTFRECIDLLPTAVYKLNKWYSRVPYFWKTGTMGHGFESHLGMNVSSSSVGRAMV